MLENKEMEIMGEDKRQEVMPDVLKGVNLSQNKIELLKQDPDLLNLIEHNLLAKREANYEAKKYREKLEQLEAEKKAQEEDALRKQGEFEKLYNQTKEQLSIKDQKIRDMLIQKEVGLEAIRMGLKKTQYLKLLDVDSLEVDMDSLSVKKVKDVLEKFKEENPDFFQEAKEKVKVSDVKPNTRQTLPNDDRIKQLELIARQTQNPRDIATWHKALRETEK